VLFCWEDGRPPHPDTITRRFKKLAAAAGLPEIDLHDVRHSYATVGRNAKIDWKALSQRIGHSDVAFHYEAVCPRPTWKPTAKSLPTPGGADHRRFARPRWRSERVRARLEQAPCTNPCTNHKQKALSLFEKGPLGLGSGGGI